MEFRPCEFSLLHCFRRGEDELQALHNLLQYRAGGIGRGSEDIIAEGLFDFVPVAITQRSVNEQGNSIVRASGDRLEDGLLNSTSIDKELPSNGQYLLLCKGGVKKY